MRRLPVLLPALVSVALVPSAVPAATGAPPALTPPAPEVIREARALVQSMEASPRGPYEQIRWFCKDGSVLPPQPYGCRDHGGGMQHAQYSGARERLARLGWHVGTIFAATPWDELWSPEQRSPRLRELALERYLVDVDDGWVLRRARDYRGRVQVEDEEAAGRRLLLQMLGHAGWAARSFLLVREMARVIPHHEGRERTTTVRRLAEEIAARDASFESIRIRLHTAPDPGDVARVRAWIGQARARGAAPALLADAERLAAQLDLLYGVSGRAERLRRAAGALAAGAAHRALAGLVARIPERSGMERIDGLCELLRRIREQFAPGAGGDAAGRLALLDLSFDAEADLITTSFDWLRRGGHSRRDLLQLARRLVDAGYGAGFLSGGERAALQQPLERLLAPSPGEADPGSAAESRGRGAVPSRDYLRATRTLEQAGAWSAASVRYTFAEALVRYTALAPGAARFTDDLLRGSALLPLAEVTRRLSLDAQQRAGIAHLVFGARSAGLLGLNAGVASGRLRILSEEDLAAPAKTDQGDIVVLPRTVSDLGPVAGILTAGEGNLLSHVQMLARNLGIPNVSVPESLARRLAAHAGERVVLAVGGDGSVVLARADAVPAAGRAALALRGGSRASAGSGVAGKLKVPVPDLSVDRPLPLSGLHADMSGRIVGPKAGNAGELAQLFPGHVAPGIALPFGVFAEHLARGPGAPRVRLRRAFNAFRRGELDEAGLAGELARVRADVAGLRLADEVRVPLAAMMEREFGAPGTYGLFVRSDTNVEDLPGFTGAGLNETIPNVVGLDDQLAAVAKVWSSVFSPRAVAWRAGLLANPEEVYSSVLLMKSVPSDKSGVLVTADLAGDMSGDPAGRHRGITVSTAWGVGGAVDGEVAETLVLHPDGTHTLLSEAEAPYRRHLRPEGGIDWLPAAAGAVLGSGERQALRRLAAEVRDRYRPVTGPDGRPLPWDIEFGFVGEKLMLFQIRPLVERGRTLAERLVSELGGGAGAKSATTDLDQPPAAPQAATGHGRCAAGAGTVRGRTQACTG